MAGIWVATRKGLFGVDGDSGAITSTAFLGVPVTLVLDDSRDNTLYAALDHGHFGTKMHRSDDRGKSWKEIDSPKYPEKPENSDDKTEWSTKMIWALAAGGPEQPGRVWAGTIPGGLFLSNDRGDSWQLVESLWQRDERQNWFGGGADAPGIHSLCVDPRDSKTVVLGVSCGGVWRTTDDGASWENIGYGQRAEFMPPEKAGDIVSQDPHCVVRSPSHPDVMWMQHHNGIFFSKDGGVNWNERHGEPSSFGFAVCVSRDNPNKAWFVPAIKDENRIPHEGKVVVSMTEDGGETFRVITEGLPQTHAYDLVYRHAMDITAGDRLAFGSTTGNLWASNPGGTAWKNLSHHLPPIYAVRWQR